MGSLCAFLLLVSLVILLYTVPISCQLRDPMACNTVYTCPAYLYYTLDQTSTPDYVAMLFNVSLDDLKREDSNLNTGGVIVSVVCTCLNNAYSAQTHYGVNETGGTQNSIATGVYENLAIQTDQPLVDGDLLQIKLYCGCLDPPQPLLSYVVQPADSLAHLAQQFNASVDALQSINNVSNPNVVISKLVLYIPVYDSEFVGLGMNTSTEYQGGHGGIALGVIVGIVLSLLFLIAAIAIAVFFAQKRKMCCYKQSVPLVGPGPRSTGSNSGVYDGARSSLGSPLKSPSWSLLGSVLQCGNMDCQDANENMKRRISVSSKDMMTGMFGLEKPIIFAYEEVVEATKNFHNLNKIGVGAYGCVFYGILREQEVAIKRMKTTKTQEFFAELKVLCKVHHTNLVELIGYSASEEELFLIYEYAENRAVSDRLHDPLSKGLAPLTWNARVQIGLDAGRGLEYIHEHTKAHYVHRDVKTSNILLDGFFRAKVADFGLAKLIEQSSDAEAATGPLVQTFGYLAPECLRNGQETAKMDVYAFGVVLFELITGQQALLKSQPSQSERRSLISVMLAALDNCSAFNVDPLKALVDPLLQDTYPPESVYRMARLGRVCVEEDPRERPDMKQVVLTLSHILLASIEWEATLAGNSQVFSGLVQGR